VVGYRPPTVSRSNVRRGFLAICLLSCALLVGAPAAPGATRHVAPGGANVGDCRSEPCASLGYAYSRSAPGDVIEVAAGAYPAQVVPAGSKAVTFHGADGATLRELDNHADKVTFDGIDVDAGFAVTVGFENHGAADVTFRNGRIGNVTDDKGALVGGANFTFDHVVFHDVRVTHPSVHNECVFAIGVPGMTVRNSLFRACATMDLFFTYGDWWTPLPPGYGNVTLENNVFAHATTPTPGSWHHYGLAIGKVGPDGGSLTNWVVRHNTFETPAAVEHMSSSGSRWVGNLGTWDCVPGMRYRFNVGKRCARTDKPIRPASSTSTRVAAFRWVDPAANDFHLTRGSAAIDAGDPEDAPATDRDGVPRDRRPDAGAYEFAAARQRARSVMRSARLQPRVLCKRKTRPCPRVALLELTVAEPVRVRVRVERLRDGGKPRHVRSLSRRVRKRTVVRIRSSRLRRGRYRVVVTASASGGRSARVVLGLRVR
jgi:hypothetical protein